MFVKLEKMNRLAYVMENTFKICVVKFSRIVDFTAGLPSGSLVAINYDNISVNGKGSTKKTYLFPTSTLDSPPRGRYFSTKTLNCT